MANEGIPHIKIAINEDDLTGGALEIIKNLRLEWPVEDIAFQLLTDGITNKLVKCYRKSLCTNCNNNQINDIVLVRVYGPKTELLIDRKAEALNILMLNQAGLAPQLYATFENGLAYQFAPGRTLTPETVTDPKLYRLVARQMARLHKVTTNYKSTYYMNGRNLPVLWEKLEAFLQLVPQRYSQIKIDNRYRSVFGGDKSKISEEIRILRNMLEITNKNSTFAIVFAHNDLLLGNIIYDECTNSVTFIDYEYAAPNYQAYDIGNHFAEFVGLDNLDYIKHYPDERFQLDWLAEYLKEFTSEANVCPVQLRQLYVAVNRFALVAHIFWGLWALIQAEYSTIDFDYIEYAAARFNEYYSRKDQFLKLT